MKQVVIGAGEVGRAIGEVLDVEVKDIHEPVGTRDVLHICFPWSPDFEDAVRAYQHAYRPSLTVIHSTVPVGTSRRLGAVHSPVTGKHPHLAESVRTFTKFFGGERAQEAADLFDAVKVWTRCTPAQETTEAGKLWQTLQYGWLIALQKEMYYFCGHWGADPDVAYRQMNEEYNAGYRLMGEPFTLPIIKDMPGPIGGHCVIPNTELTSARLALLLRELDHGW